MFNVFAAKTRLATFTSEFSPQTKPSDCFKLLCEHVFVSVWVCVKYNLVFLVPSNKDEWPLAISAVVFDLQRN